MKDGIKKTLVSKCNLTNKRAQVVNSRVSRDLFMGTTSFALLYLFLINQVK